MPEFIEAPQSEKAETSRLMLKRFWEMLRPFLVLVIIFTAFGLRDEYSSPRPSFFTAENVRRIAKKTAVVGVAALGMTVVIVSGGIDLSVGTAIALCSTVLAACLKENYPPTTAISLAILTGCFCGLINGLLISGLRVVPFIITLGTMRIFEGIAETVTKGGAVHLKEGQIPDWLILFNSTSPEALYAGFPLGFWLMLLLAFGMFIVLKYSVFGRYVFALGSNESTARLCGVNIWANKLAVYTIAGFFAGVAGVYLFSHTTVGDSTAGTGKELYVIAAVVIGGGSLSGGKGTISGSLVGAALIFVIETGGTILGIDNRYQDMMLGCIIITAVTVDQFRQRRETNK